MYTELWTPLQHPITFCCNSHLPQNLKFKKLDVLIASDIVGDGSNDIMGPFQTAQTQFYCKRSIPLCTGRYREVNKDFNKVLQQLAQEAAAGHDGLTILQLINTDKKGGAY
jgi:hypothetical protein